MDRIEYQKGGPVKFSDGLDQLHIDRRVRHTYGEAYVTPDGATVIPVARIKERGGKRRSAGAQDTGADQTYGWAGVPLGVFVVRGNRANWVPVVDANRVALVGVLTGLLAAVIGSLAVLRRPPWPQITITANR